MGTRNKKTDEYRKRVVLRFGVSNTENPEYYALIFDKVIFALPSEKVQEFGLESLFNSVAFGDRKRFEWRTLDSTEEQKVMRLYIHDSKSGPVKVIRAKWDKWAKTRGKSGDEEKCTPKKLVDRRETIFVLREEFPGGRFSVHNQGLELEEIREYQQNSSIYQTCGTGQDRK